MTESKMNVLVLTMFCVCFFIQEEIYSFKICQPYSNCFIICRIYPSPYLKKIKHTLCQSGNIWFCIALTLQCVFAYNWLYKNKRSLSPLPPSPQDVFKSPLKITLTSSDYIVLNATEVFQKSCCYQVSKINVDFTMVIQEYWLIKINVMSKSKYDWKF